MIQWTGKGAKEALVCAVKVSFGLFLVYSLSFSIPWTLNFCSSVSFLLLPSMATFGVPQQDHLGPDQTVDSGYSEIATSQSPTSDFAQLRRKAA